MVTRPRSVAKTSGHLTMDKGMITSQQLMYMPVGIPFHEHCHLSNLEGYGGLEGLEETPFLGFYGHPAAYQGAPQVGAPLPTPPKDNHSTHLQHRYPVIHGKHDILRSARYFKFGGCGGAKRTDFNGRPSTVTFSHYPASNVSAALSRNKPNIPPKLQGKILQDDFIEFNELLQANFCFKYTSVGTRDAYEMVLEKGSFVMKLKQKGTQINGLTSWLHIGGLYEQVLLTVNLYWPFELTHYRTSSCNRIESSHGKPSTPTTSSSGWSVLSSASPSTPWTTA